MATQPKTWLESEVVQMIVDEARAFKHDCNLRTRQFSWQELAENIYARLDAHNLIDRTP